MSPAVIHFTSVFFLSAVALFPLHQPKFFAALIGATALIGASISACITVQVVRTDMTNYVEDYLACGILPGLGYLTLLAAAASIYLEKDLGLDALAGALLLLAIINIRNARDLTLTMVRRHPRPLADRHRLLRLRYHDAAGADDYCGNCNAWTSRNVCLRAPAVNTAKRPSFLAFHVVALGLRAREPLLEMGHERVNSHGAGKCQGASALRGKNAP